MVDELTNMWANAIAGGHTGTIATSRFADQIGAGIASLAGEIAAEQGLPAPDSHAQGRF